MIIIAGIVWILIWSLAGYFSVKAILMGVERRRAERNMTFLFEQRKALEKKASAITGNKDITYNPFEGLL